MESLTSPQWIAGTAAAILNVIASTIFFSYCIYKFIFETCGLGASLSRSIQKWKDKYSIGDQSTDFEISTKVLIQHPARDAKSKKIRGYRSTRKKLTFLNQSMRFLIYLQIASLGMCLDKIVGIFTNTSRIMCVIQALCLHIFGLEMHLWSLVISFYLFSTALLLPRSQMDNTKLHITFEICAHIFVHTITIVLVSLPHIFGVIGPTSGWCWIDTTTHPKVGTILVFTSFFGPVWVIMILTSILYNIVLFWVLRSIKNTVTISSYLKNEKHLKLTIKLILYPGISLLVWIIPTVNRILNSIGYPYVPMQVAHSFCISLNGTLNVLVYFFNPLKYMKFIFLVFCFPLYMYWGKKRKLKKHKSYEDFCEQPIWEKVQYLARHGNEYEDDLSTFSEEKKLSFMDNIFASDEDSMSDDDYLNLDEIHPSKELGKSSLSEFQGNDIEMKDMDKLSDETNPEMD